VPSEYTIPVKWERYYVGVKLAYLAFFFSTGKFEGPGADIERALSPINNIK
jgi:hypothetical protein